MINAHICPGDYVFVKSQTSAQNGDIVVALTEDNETTLKRFYKKNKLKLFCTQKMIQCQTFKLTILKS